MAEAATKIYHHKIYTRYVQYYIEKMEHTQGISAFAAFTCTVTSGRRKGCSDGMRHVSSPSLPSLPELSRSDERLVLPVYTSDRSEPFGSILAALAAWVTVLPIYRYVASLHVIYSLLKIFRVRNFHGLSQPQKYFNNKNFPNYGIQYVTLQC